MSNRSGDLYRCSDPDCGCEVEVRRPSERVSSGGAHEARGPREMRIDDGIEKADTAMEMAYIRAQDAHLPPPVSGDGLEESRNSPGKSAGPESTSRATPRPSATGGESMHCFCGAEMQDTGTTVRTARVATMKL